MSRTRNRPLSSDELKAFGDELDAIRARVTADIGLSDARYIRRIVAAVRWSGVAGRALLFLGAFVHVVLVPAWITGVILLALSKILENMEVGHNVMHGQYDWMNDPRLNGRTYEWDIVATSDNWRKTHNFRHHTYTNVRGMDDDIGYGLLRIFPEQRWRPFYLMQPAIAVVFMLLFEWGVAIQDLRLGRWFAGKTSTAEIREAFRPVRRKMGRQLLKDYVVFPLLAGPYFLPVLLGNIVANVLRSIWTFVIIFCGHFTADAEVFPKQSISDESRGHWYLRQLRGSSNIAGGKLFNVLTGNLSHQIEHHFYPDLPANRYAAIAVEVKQVCARYGQSYNTGSLPRQFGQVIWRILRHAFPSHPALQNEAKAGAI
ncbi:fatty acid desaturase family protein [Frateuria aurantia]|uniref:Fatty acid desaturase n=1 Tax=Frateuria aurantia (strain ATCC 33424 / DSM 6220 / KCTC 2777 / LMG 1558 / NBRC 3245 / NCIMB 13370) TaxID=767434 RepID=H8L6L4_FRAAD|nr:acyl-CoA desaturase [Frateuria aurantia]AFC86830.1 fatty acid desaturase [Frateuria aurantia DSM 6220]